MSTTPALSATMTRQIAEYEVFAEQLRTEPAYRGGDEGPCCRWLGPLLAPAMHLSSVYQIVRCGLVADRPDLYGPVLRATSHRVLRAVERFGSGVHIEGLRYPRQTELPVVYVGNHMSSLETVVLPGILMAFGKVSFIIKESLLKYPFFGKILAGMGAIPVTRENPREDLARVLKLGGERLAAGYSVVVFPQSTRTRRFEPEQFTTLGVKLARRAGVPAIPLAIKTDMWQNGRLVKDIGPVDPNLPVHFEFGEPLRIAGTGRDEQAAIVAFIATRLAAWQAADEG